MKGNLVKECDVLEEYTNYDTPFQLFLIASNEKNETWMLNTKVGFTLHLK